MRNFTTEHTVYKFEELTPEAQEKALENNYNINVDDTYWYYDEGLEDIALEYGITLKWPDLCFDLDRSNYLYLDNHSHGSKQETSYISDMAVFLKKAGIDLRTKDAKRLFEDGFTLGMKHYGGGDGRNYIEEYSDISAETDAAMAEALEDMTDRLKQCLRQQYDYLTDRDAIIETFDANEYEFYEDGRMA